MVSMLGSVYAEWSLFWVFYMLSGHMLGVFMLSGLYADYRRYNFYVECFYAKCHYAECCVAKN